MASSALSSRRRYLRRPKVCKAMPNPGRCHPPPPPPPLNGCVPAVLEGFYSFTDLPWCHGFWHGRIFKAERQPDYQNPWVYVDAEAGWPPGDYVWFKLWKTPEPRLYANPQYWDMPHVSCCEALSHEIPFVWCVDTVITINDWDQTPGPCSCSLQVAWKF